MSLLLKGVTKLSELTIDVDKDWQGKGISNLKEIVAGMAAGDTIFRGAAILERLGKGTLGYFLAQAAVNPYWDEVPRCLAEIDIPSVMGVLGIASTPDFANFALACGVGNPDAEAIVSADQSHNKNAPIASSYTTAVV